MILFLLFIYLKNRLALIIKYCHIEINVSSVIDALLARVGPGM